MNMPLNIDWQQILLHLLNFVILFAILYFLLYEPVKKFMDKRTEYYKELDNEAKAKLKSSEEAKVQYLSKLEAVDNEIADIKEKARKEVERVNAIKLKQAEEEAAKLIEDAHQSVDREHERMLREVQNEISDMVTVATEKLVLQSSTSESYEQFLAAVEGGDTNE